MAKKKVFDRNILIIIGFVLLVALIVVIFKVVTGKKPCPEVKFKVTSVSPIAGSPVTFQDETEGATKWDWDFGDSSAHGNTVNPSHTYNNPGDYTVLLTVNETCQEAIHVVVDKQFIEVDTTLPMGKINGPALIMVGKEATFTDESSDAKSWEWAFAESGKTDATTQTAKYTFLKPGQHSITLNINDGKCKTATMMVTVTAKVHTAEAKPNPNQIDDGTFVKMLNELHNPEKSYMVFEKYLDGNMSMVITVNGKKAIFSSYCKGLSLDTRYNVKSASLTKDGRGYITGVDITEEKSAH